ncbi:glycerol-3-phosphate dehydrogenase/oxidase [Peribacillus butanolivorans]|uniref:glycerol-3-phosphate dehydrogenase/oxidase n=1 Tax=Peribacillus TaxID=2675229 RepID=UPI0006F6C2BD|nr:MULTISPECIES: glycerol-3-phosphate dehydrogenase/oxidase [unclassified Peribacillus]KQU22140.1 glycerol-3-phosphate dehydrogenase [Bacillus sp. Leaf13]MBK5461603.1 glycerol-3-phosphate dehydrogenase/oxidase [Peribacillus sp. TH27]MBK5499747.1 glycerol-3-phosphate dehydrogenase/oxidase [Peribacillus sp. TH14]WMX55167.1 glycerol-3-phosphate dehydrogenase/oxidase [Peribacillus sp. R9-11]
MRFSNIYREETIELLKKEKFDVLVIGGGITGAGISLDATTRGMKVALVEMQDFAAGTSSRSTKLVHGGLRYLKQFEIKMVAEVGKEREIVYENGPHVTTPERMLLPMHKGGTFGKFSTSIGLRVYDFLAGVKKSERRKMLSVSETLKMEPLVKKEGLKGGGHYVEYRTDDARLTIEVMKAAVDKGATPINYTKVEKLLYENGKVIGVQVNDILSGNQYEIYADKVINAAGPWVDSIREKDQSKKGKTLKLSKGVHVVIDQSKFPLKQAIYFDTPDGRMIFAIPRAGKAYVGTTDTFYNGDPAVPTVTSEDRAYLLKAIGYMFPEVKVSDEDIESSWAGVRPLILEEGKDPSEISRKDEIWESDSGLITIAGGKLTGYRKMAKTTVDLVAGKLSQQTNRSYPNSSTKKMPISGGDVGGSINFSDYIQTHIQIGVDSGLTAKDSKELLAMYGSNAAVLFNIAKSEGDVETRTGLPQKLFVQLQYALDHEMAATPVDFFFRRTGTLLFDIDLVQTHKSAVIKYMAEYFGWTESTKTERTNQLEQEIHGAIKVS